MAGSKLTPQLGDKHLDEKESVIRQREELLDAISNRKAYGQEDIEKAERSEGPRLYYTVLLKKLKTIYPDLFAKDGIPGHLAIYRPKTEGEKLTDGYDLSAPRWHNEAKYITGFPKDFIPEWGHYLNDTDGIAIKDFRGWRSILISLIKQGLVTYKAAIEEFGDPIHDQRSKYWFEQLQEFISEDKNNARGNGNSIH